MSRRNPPAATAASVLRAERRAAAQASRNRFGPPDAETLKRWRADLVARRGYDHDIDPDFLASVKRRGGWSGDVDWRIAPDQDVAFLWREHEHWRVHGKPPSGWEVMLGWHGGDEAKLRAGIDEEIARRKALGIWWEEEDALAD